MKPTLISSLVTGALALGALTPTVFANTSAPSSMSAKSITVNGQAFEHPDGFVYQGTTYMPIWYVEQTLNLLGIQNGWDGTHWTMTSPATLTPDLSNPSPGTGGKQVIMNGTALYAVNSIVATDPASHADTTFFPVWYIMQIMDRLHIANQWDGRTWSVQVAPTVMESDLPESAWTPGVVSGIHSHGLSMESWYQNGGDGIYLDNNRYTSGSNKLSISGHASVATNELVVWVVDQNNHLNNAHCYSVPVKDGKFSATIVLPFQGEMAVEFSASSQSAGKDFTTDSSAPYTIVDNNQTTLDADQMHLLQSWLCNYNEVSNLNSLTQAVVGPLQSEYPETAADDKQTRTYQEIKAVSDWASQNIDYNWPAYNTNQIPWQQMTDDLTLHYGVCQDISSVACGMLRSLGIPTELVQGEGGDPSQGDFGPHQWCMAWDGVRWVKFDPTFDQVNYQDTSIASPDGVDDSQFDNSDFDQWHLDASDGQW